MPSARKRAATSSEISGSSRIRMRGSISTCVTCEPSRAKHCASSLPIGPPPSTTRRLGRARRSQTVSEVSGPSSRRPGNRRNERPRARRDDDVARRERALAAVFEIDLDRPGRGDLCGALKAFDAERGVALDRIMRLDRFDHALHALHHLAEIEIDARRSHAELGGATDVGEELRRSDQRLRRHAAGIEAVAAHAVLFDERHFSFHRRGDVRRDQTGRAGADHDEIALDSCEAASISRRPCAP